MHKVVYLDKAGSTLVKWFYSDDSMFDFIRNNASLTIIAYD